MAYLLTAVMTGGVAALMSLFEGHAIGQIALNYIVYGHLGMATLVLATVAARRFDRKKTR
ncbi:hypothetical protein [Sulfitobacter guttiformis]|uniref:Uncharacterized protein n=1 Tax=Sulfitobacter guttiformis TaxID=74349 RepID=A0A420DIL0_9RHOB|nr:hypothetical protein [Sulfitobacter guttiformis]KIN72149.1 hypothetical protein Z949_1318 [Sulfitobacter guttiformis KCTC 32187]RKE94076.1 hypothetical protein C8N30_3185 [Sulfitobacter guttiformis]